MAEISNIGPGNDNNFNGTNSIARRDSTEKRTSAFDDYKNFQQKKLKEYQNFRDKKLKEYENFKNQKLKEYEEHKSSVLNNDSSNLIGADKAEDDKGAQIPQKIEYPKMDKPDTPPVKIQEQDTADEPANVKNPDNNQKIPDKTVSKNKQQIPFSTVEREGVIGKYKITAGENGDGFLLATEMNVFGGGEASKFFKPGGFFDDKIKYDEGTKQYSFRGIKANSRFMLQMTMQNVSTNLSIHNAIYNDLMSKKSSGLELTKPEQNFVEYYLKNLEHYGLGVDANGNIIDKTE